MRYVYIITLVVAGIGCAPTKIGTGCHSDGDCNVKGQHCVSGLNGGPKICTHTCSSNTGDTGCPIGYDCSTVDQGLGPTCNKVVYATDPNGDPVLFGKSCATDESVCGSTGDPNPMPMCRKAPDYSQTPPVPVAQDPNAYCTGSCTTDADCPIAFTCRADYDGVTKCLERTLCDECEIDDDCPAEFPACVPTQDGKSHYCTKPCQSGGQCPGGAASIPWMSCSQATDVNGNAGSFCLHRYGACVGDGQVCAPCRVKADCQSGLSCLTNPDTLESFCTKQCTADSECTSDHPAACDDKQPTTQFDPFPSGLCTGDTTPTKNYTGEVTCWPM